MSVNSTVASSPWVPWQPGAPRCRPRRRGRLARSRCRNGRLPGRSRRSSRRPRLLPPWRTGRRRSPCSTPGHVDSGGGASGPMDGDLAGPRNRSRTAPAGWAASPRSSWWRAGPPRRGAGSRRSARGPPGPSGTWISALIGQERRVPTLQGGESPMPDSGSPVVPHDGGRNVAEPSASNAGQRPVSRRQALAYGSSLAAALPPHPPRPLRPRPRRRPRLCSTCRLAWRSQAHRGRRRAARPTDRRVDVHGTVALSRNAPGKPSNVEALLHGKDAKKGSHHSTVP